jgi:hypothetical protein
LEPKKFAYGPIKHVVLFIASIIVLIFTVLTCQRFEAISVLIVQTDTITGITFDRFIVTGNITNTGEEEIIQHGFCWSETKNPSIDLESKSQLGKRENSGKFNQTITGLSGNTTYFVRAYASNNQETKYGEVKSVTTASPPLLPFVTTDSVTNISQTTALS